MNNPRRATIVGVHLTRQARRLEGRTSQELIIEAVRGALDDASMSAREVDGVALEWPGPGGYAAEPSNWAPYFKNPLRWHSEGSLDTSGARGAMRAAAAIEAGLCDTVILGGGQAGFWAGLTGKIGGGTGHEFADCFGITVMAQFAMVAQRHMHEFNIPPEYLANIAATIRNHGHANPAAAMHGAGPYTVADVLASPYVAEPLHRLECCFMNDGACAVVITTAERARDLKQRPVSILGAAAEFHRWGDPPLYRDLRHLGKDAVARTLGPSGTKIQDVDVFSLYDATAYEVLRQYEMLGLCDEGEGGAFALDGNITFGGAAPTNLDGGLLAFSWVGKAQTTMRLIEAVRQVRGTAVGHQVEGAELAFTANAGSGAWRVEMMLVGRA